MSLVIQCGPARRILRYPYGWKLERLTEAGNWKEDAPAYPANLGQAFEMMLERIYLDSFPVNPEEVSPKRLRPFLENVALDLSHAMAALELYAARARQVGQELEEDLVND